MRETSGGLRAVLALLLCCGAFPLGCASPPASSPRAAAAPAPGAAQLSNPLEEPEPPRAMFTRSTSVRASRVEAELVRRSGGEWVIVELHPQAIEPGSLKAAPAQRQGLPHAALEETLQAYERAFERRDEAGLARVWLMNPSEREEVGRMFRSSDGISVAISDPVVEVAGDHAKLRFDQRFSLMRSPGISRAFGGAYRRALAASDSVGKWAIDSLVGD